MFPSLNIGNNDEVKQKKKIFIDQYCRITQKEDKFE